jgi:hypothetical protein
MTKPGADTTMNYVFSINVWSDIFTTHLRVFDLADRPVLLRHFCFVTQHCTLWLLAFRLLKPVLKLLVVFKPPGLP